MNQEIITKVLSRMEHGVIEYAVRDITFLTCSIFNYSHLVSFKKFFDFDKFTMVFWFMRLDGNVVFYRSAREYMEFSEEVGGKYVKDPEFAAFVAQRLRDLSDEINHFVKSNPTKEAFIEGASVFLPLYRDFFAFHQAVYWPTEYLLKAKKVEKDSSLVKMMDSAYTYNENVIPNVDKYFFAIGVSDLSYDQVLQNKGFETESTARLKSSLLLDGHVYTINYDEAGNIDTAIQQDCKNHISSSAVDVKGLSAYRGIVTGKVKKITDLSKLNTLREGDILVTTQTRPQYNSFTKHAKAIVTDEGGLLCHASVLAREFKIPCIVGTKFATKVFKDGDVVEVDADNGTVKFAS